MQIHATDEYSNKAFRRGLFVAGLRIQFRSGTRHVHAEFNCQGSYNFLSVHQILQFSARFAIRQAVDFKRVSQMFRRVITTFVDFNSRSNLISPFRVRV